MADKTTAVHERGRPALAREGERLTVVICSTVAHAENVTAAVNSAGISAAVIHGDLDASMGLEMGRVDHEHFGFSVLFDQFLQDLCYDPRLAPTKPAVKKGFVRAIDKRRIPTP